MNKSSFHSLFLLPLCGRFALCTRPGSKFISIHMSHALAVNQSDLNY